MPQIIVNPGTKDEYSVEILPGSTTIGRADSNQISILDKSLSRVHARISRRGRTIAIEDLDSTNGTEVNGTRIRTHELNHGDAVRCGDVLMMFVEDPRILKEVALHRTTGFKLGGGTINLGQSTLALPSIDDASGTAAERLSILLQVAEILSSPEEISTLLERIVTLLFEIMDIDRAVLLILDEKTGELVPRFARTRDGSDANQVAKSATANQSDQREDTGTVPDRPRDPNDRDSVPQPPASASYSRHIVQHVLAKNVAVLTSDAHADARFRSAASVLLQSIRASMCAPLRKGDKILGVLYVDNVTTPDRYGDQDLEFLGAFANQAAIAIENSRLYNKIQQEAVLRNNFLRFFPPTTIKRLMDDDMGDLGIIDTVVTAMFADISDFTAMSSSMQPREVMEMLNEYFPVMAEIVFKYEGTLEKYIGDALLVAWGAPYAHEDDAERAVLAAMEMQQALVKLNQSWQGRRHLSIHIGLNTGPAAAGNIGSENFIQYATIGDTTNVAARICSIAGANEIVMSAATLAKVRRLNLPIEQLKPVMVKGKKEPLTLFRLDWRRPI